MSITEQDLDEFLESINNQDKRYLESDKLDRLYAEVDRYDAIAYDDYPDVGDEDEQEWANEMDELRKAALNLGRP